MGLIRNRLVSESLDNDGLVVRAAIPFDLHLKVQMDKPTIVYADEIIVRGTVRTNGHDLALYCRELHFVDGGAIDASGAQGLPNFSEGLRPEGARDPGAPGPDGADGGDGGPGGRIVIRSGAIIGNGVLLARGGAGGRAQDGGHGQRGAGGASGRSDTIESSAVPAWANGAPGGPGGSAGLPDQRGNGGPGGAVDVAVIQAPAAGQLDAQATAGDPAFPAQPGLPGGPGPGGGPGQVTFRKCEFVDIDGPGARRLSAAPVRLADGDQSPEAALLADAARVAKAEAAEVADAGVSRPPMAFRAELYHNLLTRAAMPVPLHRTCYTDGTAWGSQGADGPEGDRRVAEVDARQVLPAVADGTVVVANLAAGMFAEPCDPVFLDVLVAEIEDEYRRKGRVQNDTLRRKIEFWLEALAGQAAHTEALARLYSMARKQALGLDVYGYSLEQTPLLNFDTYQRLVQDGALAAARLIEEAYADYALQADQQDAALASLRAALGAARNASDTLRQQHGRVRDNATALLASLPVLDAAMMAAYNSLMVKRHEFDDAIAKAHPGCDLVGSLTAVATIVVGVQSGGAGFASALAAGKRLYDSFTAEGVTLDGLWDNRKVIEDDLKAIGKGAAAVDKAIKEIREAVATLAPERRKLPAFIAEREEFDRVAAQFTDLPQAREYKEAGHHYLKCVETRNQAIVDYNAALAQWVELQAMLAASRRIEDQAASSVGIARDLSQATVMGMMTRLYVDALALAGQMVHAEGKALGYLFGRPADVTFTTLNVASIAAAHADITNKWREFKERFRPKRNLKPGVLAFQLKHFVTDEAWEAFIRTGVLAFTLRRDHPDYAGVLRYMSGLRITGMSIALDGAAVPPDLGYLGWIVRQLGHETVYSSEANPVRFSHVTISATTFTAFNGQPPMVEDDFSEGELYAGISPYASWIISCDLPTLRRISGIAGITFGVSGYFVESGSLPIPAVAVVQAAERASASGWRPDGAQQAVALAALPVPSQLAVLAEAK